MSNIPTVTIHHKGGCGFRDCNCPRTITSAGETWTAATMGDASARKDEEEVADSVSPSPPSSPTTQQPVELMALCDGIDAFLATSEDEWGSRSRAYLAGVCKALRESPIVRESVDEADLQAEIARIIDTFGSNRLGEFLPEKFYIRRR